MNLWTIEYNGIKKPIDQWKIGQLKRYLINKACDKVYFKHFNPTLFDEDAFKPASSLKIFFKNQPWFYGIIIKTPSMSHSKIEEQHYHLAGPWWYLENLVYQQEWLEADINNNSHQNNENTSLPSPQLSNVTKSRVILGQDQNGNRLNSQDQIKHILQYTINQGAPFQIGNITIDIEFPYDEVKDISCAEALLKVLRWTPDSVSFFDYSTTPHPTLHILKKSSLKESHFNLKNTKGCPLQKVHLSPRYDLIPPAVVLKYEQSQTYNGQVWSKTFIDKYPENATGKEFKAIVLTIDLEGEKGQSIAQKVKTDYIDVNSTDWWKAHLPALANIPNDKIKIENVRRTTELPNEIIEGSVTPWMHKDVQEDTIYAQISYESESEIVVQRGVSLKINATNASSKTYFKSNYISKIEAPSRGLARSLFESLNILQYEGEIELSLDIMLQLGLELKILGSFINIEGGKSNWTAMKALVQEVQEDVDAGLIKVKVGLSKHLGVDDMIEILKTNRYRNAATRSETRSTGIVHAGGISMGTHNRIESIHQGPGQYKKIVFLDPQIPNKKIVLNADDISHEVTVQLREEHVCHNGQLMRRLILSSEPFNLKNQ